MGYGDEIMATGMARGAAGRGRRIAFGDGRKIIWSQHAEKIFRNNPNIAPPGAEGSPDLEWVGFYKGHRIYNRPGGNGWLWNLSFRPTPGEFFFDERERAFARSLDAGLVVIEPSVPLGKAVAQNKLWRFERFQQVANALKARGHRVLQFDHGTRMTLGGVERLYTESFRHAAAALGRAALFIGHEGGMHHAAAAVGVRAVVIFGGFIPPAVTGYDSHVNLADPSGEPACGSTTPCAHCRRALDAITAETVIEAALEQVAKYESAVRRP